MKRSFYLLIFAAALRGEVPPDPVIRAILADRIDTLHQSVGIVVGIVDVRPPGVDSRRYPVRLASRHACLLALPPGWTSRQSPSPAPGQNGSPAAPRPPGG